MTEALAGVRSSKMPSPLGSHFTWVLLVALQHILVLLYLNVMVIVARNRYGLPRSHSFKEYVSAESDGNHLMDQDDSEKASMIGLLHDSRDRLTPVSEADHHAFGCYQEAFQSTASHAAPFFVMLAVAGSVYPLMSASSGALYSVSRIVYAHGYYSGKPKKRHYGAFGYLGYLCLFGLSAYVAIVHV